MPPSARRTPAWAAERADGTLVIGPATLGRGRDRPRPAVRTRPRPGDRRRHGASPMPQRPISTQRSIAPGVEVERRWRRSASVGCLRPGRVGAVPELAAHDRRPGAGRGRRRGSSSPRRRTATAGSTRSSSARPACSASTRSIVAGGAQAIGALAYGLPDAGIEPVDRIVGPGNAWVTAAKIEVCGEVGIDLPAGPSEGLVLADATGRSAGRRARPHHPGRARSRLPGHPRHDRPGVRRRRRGRGRRAAAPSPIARPSSRARSREHGRIVLAPDLDDGHRVRQRLRPGAPARSTSSRSSRPSSGSSTPARCSSARGRRSPPATTRPGANHVLPTGGLARSSGAL